MGIVSPPKLYDPQLGVERFEGSSLASGVPDERMELLHSLLWFLGKEPRTRLVVPAAGWIGMTEQDMSCDDDMRCG